ncbi:hypothetical protein PHYPSEUDO_007572 [Phytophthora pseudosyringae]|uniref:RxLR effector protein n=1 Tax=Phytophthora pseudosyringae TaxID=221518 RepID=A0A8T1VG83_9STRA|nr:hypothetical protein PHYPSEUDO_007572 [Phytophthora pseudosyringae]
MRLAYVMAATLAALFAGSNAVSAAATSNQAKVSAVETHGVPAAARVLNTDSNRFLRVESTIEDEERALPSSLAKLSEKIANKAKPLASKLNPVVEKMTGKTMSIAVKLKPITDTFTGKLKPIATKLMPILKPIAARLNKVPIVQKLVEKFKTFAAKIKNYNVGGHTVGERYTMNKFENWFKQNKSPDDVKAMLKVGEGTSVNTKNYDLWTQYSAFYRWAQRDKEVKAAAAAGA